MQRIKRLILFLSIILALLTTFIGHTVFINEVEERTAIELIPVPVAKHNIQPMKKITPEDIQMVKIPPQSVQQLTILNNQELIVGRTPITQIEKGSPFTEGQLIDEDGGVPFFIEQGKRAITIPSSPVISVGGYLKPGHFVDILWTTEQGGVPLTILALQNIEVLALGGPSKDPLAVTGNESTITLLVTPENAQKLTFMNSHGSIKLALRKSSDEPNARTGNVTAETILLQR